MNAARQLHNLGQSVWLDHIARDLLTSGALQRYIREFAVTGLTSNPAIFEQAIRTSSSYDDAIRYKALDGKSGESLFFELALEDLVQAADLLRPIHDATGGVDGWVSLEISPLLADDTRGTVKAALQLHARAQRPNLFIKIPGNLAGIPAIEEAIFAGVPVNVTLLFSREHYLAAARAYQRGIERRISAGLDPVVASVASIFISRWDVAVRGKVQEEYRNRLGIAIAMRTYKAYRDLLATPGWQKLAMAGAQPQRLLWASTGTKDPAVSDSLYVEALAAPDTINTIPEKTLLAFAAHGKVGNLLPPDEGYAEAVIAEFTREGIDDEALAANLQREGIAAFVRSWRSLISRIATKSGKLTNIAPPKPQSQIRGGLATNRSGYHYEGNDAALTPAKLLEPTLRRDLDAYWRAANFLSVGQMYLRDNPLLRVPLKLEHVKRMLLGHWGTTPGQNFIYVHLNRIIKQYDLDMIYVSGPGHGGPAVVANAYLEGSYSEIYPVISQDEAGLRKLFTQFSFPGGIPSHASPECPGSIHEGGELGYSLSHAFGAAFDNPSLIVACVIGDGEAETGPLATAWHSNKFLDPATDGAVLPILHLNGYKIANPALLARITREELTQLLHGYGWAPVFVEGHEPEMMHEAMAAALDIVVTQIQSFQQMARRHDGLARPRWPMIVLVSPKGWTGPTAVDGRQVEGTFRSHQVPLSDPAAQPAHLALLEDWLRSYRPEELFDASGRLKPELAALAPLGRRRMSANPHANGGLLLRDLAMPDFRDYAITVAAPGVRGIGDTRVLGPFLRDVVKLNETQRNFRVFGPDETLSNGLGALFGATSRQWQAATIAGDEFLAPTGRVVEMLSEHQCQGWLEGYLLTGRHGVFNCYEAFIHIVDSMFNQHAKWLKVASGLRWRPKIASLNYLLASHVWRQDHNGFTHQDPGFIDHVVNKKAEIVRVYLPPDANCLLSVMDHCLRSRHYVNVVIAGKHPAPQWLTMAAAVRHCAAGIGIWQWAGNDHDAEPDLVMACAGDVPTLETLAAVAILRQQLPDLKIRVVNVVDLMKLQPDTKHPHGLSGPDFDLLFTADKPVIFAFHGYPGLIHRLTYRRTNHKNLHVHGYQEEGTITTAFDMTVLNRLDRFHLAMDAIDHLPQAGTRGTALQGELREKLIKHRQYINIHGEDLPEIRNWQWQPAPQAGTERMGQPE